MLEADPMEVESVTAGEVATTEVQSDESMEGEDVVDLMDLFASYEEEATKDSSAKIQILTSILSEPQERYGPKAVSLKERSIYALVRTYCTVSQVGEVMNLLTGDICRPFFEHVTKAKCAKVVRAVLDIICALAPDELSMQAQICRNIISWCQTEKRTFLRQRVEAKLAAVLFSQEDYSAALKLVDSLLVELKKLDDKQLLVETHLIESKIHHGLRGLAKAKAALTASRTCANAIYVAPALQASIDSMSGVLHCEEGDYNTAHSYFLESFEQLDQLDDEERALRCLKYMMLCKILDSLVNALKLSAKGGVGARSDKSEVALSGMISGKQGVKYAGDDIDAMSSIAKAAASRSLKDYEEVTNRYKHELQDDLLIKHHLSFLNEQLLESNLIRLIEPYSCVEISHIAGLIEMSVSVVEKKLSQMILDGRLNGILDQGKGQLIVYEDNEKDLAMEKGLEVIANMDNVISSLFVRSRQLRTMVS